MNKKYMKEISEALAEKHAVLMICILRLDSAAFSEIQNT